MEKKVVVGQYLLWVILLLGQLHGYKSCIEKERKALLELKRYLIQISRPGQSEFVHPTWTNDTKSDCCQWNGVECSHTTGRVTEIAFGTPYLKRSCLFNLSLLHPFEDVRSLNLTFNRFSSLFDYVEGQKSLRRFRNLEILDLNLNDFNSSIFPFINAATSLTKLFLRRNHIESLKELKDLTNLELLDVSDNTFNGSIPVQELSGMRKLKALDLSNCKFSDSLELKELKNLTNLEALSLASNYFTGPIPIEVFCEMKNLKELDLSGNLFVGQIPLCFGGLNKLRALDLSLNKLSGNLPSSFSSLESLEYLSLLDNNFQGSFSLNPLANLTKLKMFRLSSSSHMIQVEAESSWQPKFQLSVAALPFCNLEKIPNFLIYQKNLRLVDLSNNKLSGNVPTWLLENNQELEVFKLNNNSFTIFHMPAIVHKLQILDFSENDIGGLFAHNIGRVFPNLVHMNGASNGFQGILPWSLGDMKNISFLDLSCNNFSGELPRSFVMGCFSLQVLKLSHNKLSGHFLPRRANFTWLSVLRINNNLFTGKIGVGLLSSVKLSVLDMSENRLTGAIPSWISKLQLLEILMISNNYLEGTIPPSLLLIQDLSFLDLSGNLLSGALPSHVHSTRGLKLFLQNNNFTGPIPRTLLENVTILDLRNNKLSGSIPQFVNTQNISILLLKMNNLKGHIPKQLCDLSNIRILDLSSNKLTGSIPSCLNNLSFGKGGDEEKLYHVTFGAPGYDIYLEFYRFTFVSEYIVFYYDNYLKFEVEFAAKQRFDSYTGESDISSGTLSYMYGLDLSSNELTGVIPEELGDLSKLRSMNLSRNNLSSSIPDSFLNLKDVESLDLSCNMLHGRIPYQLTKLTSLVVFNVSYNNLSGSIPQGVQFSTLDKNNYFGNPLLCGSPTDRICEIDNGEEEDEDEDDEAVIDMLVFYWSTASTYMVALISILVLVCFDCHWRRAWLRLVDAFIVSVKIMLS